MEALAKLLPRLTTDEKQLTNDSTVFRICELSHAYSRRPRKNRDPKNYFVRYFREEQGLSQRDFARKLGIKRSHLQRLESKPWKQLSLEEVGRIAHGFGLKTETLIQRMEGHGQEVLQRISIKQTFLSLEFKQTGRLASLLRNENHCFIGSLTLLPRKELSSTHLPRSPFLFCFVLRGSVTVTFCEKEYVFREGEGFCLDREHPFELFNPHQFDEAALLVTSPAPFLAGFESELARNPGHP